MDSPDQTFADICVLYELALASGSSLDLRETCRGFVSTLAARKGFSYVAVWLRDDALTLTELDAVPETLTLFHAAPRSKIHARRISGADPLWRRVCAGPFSLAPDSHEHEHEPRAPTNTRAFFPLCGLGMLEVHGHRDLPLGPVELAQLDTVIRHFAAAIDRCLTHSHLVLEIAERERAEQEARRMQARLQEARKLEAVSRLAGGIAHDFNNLLMSILGTVELMRLDAEDPALQADLDQITTDGERAAALTKQLLTFARTKQARAEPVELDAVVREAVELLRHRPDSGIELVLDLELDARCVRGVPASLRELVLDLAFNARDAMPEGGSLTISTRAEAAPASGEPQLVLRVSDTGEGMTPEVAERAFEPFFTTKELGKGSGLGLAAAYGVVRSHGGEISTHSSPGLGTTFEVRLPELAAPCKPERDLANLGPRFAAPGLVLLVDDSAGPRQVASRLLSRLGFEVMAAPDGPTALDLLRARSDELRGAVLDVRMPGMNGVETLRRLRELNPELPVVMASGYADPEHLDELATLGVHDVLRKPYTLDELGGALARVLASA